MFIHSKSLGVCFDLSSIFESGEIDRCITRLRRRCVYFLRRLERSRLFFLIPWLGMFLIWSGRPWDKFWTGFPAFIEMSPSSCSYGEVDGLLRIEAAKTLNLLLSLCCWGCSFLFLSFDRSSFVFYETSFLVMFMHSTFKDEKLDIKS